MKLRHVAALVSVGVCVPRAAAEPADPVEFERLDYARTVVQDDMTFVPFKQVEEGVFFYGDYRLKVGPSASFRGARRLFVDVRPRAYDEGRYQSFLTAHPEVLDSHKVLMPTAAPHCELTSELADLFADVEYSATVLGPGYPALCSASIIFPADREEALRRLIAEGRALRISVNVTLCDPNSVRYLADAMLARLVTTGVLTATGEGVFNGRYFQVVRALRTTARDPALGFVFTGVVLDGSPEASARDLAARDEAALDFLRRFGRATGRNLVITWPGSDDPIYICSEQPHPLSLSGP